MYLTSILVITVLVFLNDLAAQTATEDICAKSEELIEGIQKILDFVEKNYDNFHLDGFIGLQLLQSFIKNTLIMPDKCKFKSRIYKLYKRLSNLNKSAMKVIILKDPSYYNSIKESVTQLLSFKSAWKSLERNENVFMNLTKKEYIEDDGDACFNALAKGNCTISEKCSKLFLSDERTEGYFATHIVIFLIIYKQVECYLVKDFSLSEISLDKRLNDVCYGILQENVELLKNEPSLIAPYVDIFFERIDICGGKLGFVEFFSNEAYDVLINSQNHKDGCIRERDYAKNMKKTNIVKEDESFDMPIRLSKRRDSFMRGECSSHLMGIGAASYGAFLSYLSTESTPQERR